MRDRREKKSFKVHTSPTDIEHTPIPILDSQEINSLVTTDVCFDFVLEEIESSPGYRNYQLKCFSSIPSLRIIDHSFCIFLCLRNNS